MMSTPRTTSGFSEEASTSGSSTTAGRRLANRPRSLRSRSTPSSGRFSKGRLSHFGPPTRAEQHGIGRLGLGHRLVGAGRALGVDRGAADQAFLDVEGDGAAAVHPVDDAADLAHHLGADAVAGQDEKLLVGRHGADVSCSVGSAPGGCRPGSGQA